MKGTRVISPLRLIMWNPIESKWMQRLMFRFGELRFRETWPQFLYCYCPWVMRQLHSYWLIKSFIYLFSSSKMPWALFIYFTWRPFFSRTDPGFVIIYFLFLFFSFFLMKKLYQNLYYYEFFYFVCKLSENIYYDKIEITGMLMIFPFLHGICPPLSNVGQRTKINKNNSYLSIYL